MKLIHLQIYIYNRIGATSKFIDAFAESSFYIYYYTPVHVTEKFDLQLTAISIDLRRCSQNSLYATALQT